MSRVVLSLVLLLAACDRRDEPSPFAQTETPRPSDAGARRDDPIDLHGITVRFLADGTVEIAGTDRWGKPIDSKYENLDYFRNALPVLERDLTAEQATGLRTLLLK